MNNREFIRFVMDANPTLRREEAQRSVDIVFQALRDAVGTGDTVNIPSFGVFAPTPIKETRYVYSGITGEDHEVSPHMKLKFRPSRVFEAKLTAALMVSKDTKNDF